MYGYISAVDVKLLKDTKSKRMGTYLKKKPQSKKRIIYFFLKKKVTIVLIYVLVKSVEDCREAPCISERVNTGAKKEKANAFIICLATC